MNICRIKFNETSAACIPYFVWMALLFILPSTAETYAWRTLLTAISLLFVLYFKRSIAQPFGITFSKEGVKSFVYGLLVGIIVCFLWIFPERFESYRNFNLMSFVGLGGSTVLSEPSPYEPSVCGWALTIIKLIGSAFIIAPVEEIFFRSFLYRWLQKSDWIKVSLNSFNLSAFIWMISLFALEHHTRLCAGLMAGAFYGYLAIRRGVGSAIIAHIITNLLLGLYVFYTGEWGFW